MISSYRRQTIQSVLEADLFANFMLQQMLGTLFPQRTRGPNGRSAGAPVAPDAPADHSPPGLTLPQAMMFFAMINNNNDDDDIFTGNGAHSSGPEHSTSRVFGPMRATNTNTASSPPTHHTHVIFQNLTGSSSSSSTDSGSSSSRRIEMPFQTLPPELRALFGNMSSNNRESSPRRRSSGYGQGTATNPISLLDVLDEESDGVNQLDHEDEDEDFE